jgi:phage-related minor tail protein
MDDELETLRIEVRASTSGFRSDIETMRGALDNNLVDGFSKAGGVFERGLLSAIRRGSVGFDDLKRVALQSMNEIAAQAVQGGIGSLFKGGVSGGGKGGGLGSVVSGAIGALFGLPGRATGGPVAPGAAYLVGERGPEVFVPTSSGRIEHGTGAQQRNVKVSININQPRGSDAPAALRRSSRQVASQVRRALQTF